MKIGFSNTFVKRFNSLEQELAEEVLEKVSLLENRDNHKMLKVHKLHGKLKNRWSFSVNYRIRVIFIIVEKDHIILETLGRHDIYE